MRFFTFLAPTVPFILGRLGIPIFGNKAIPSWLWHSPNDNFLLFLSQAENDLPPHGQRLTGTEPGPLIEERTWLYTLQLPLSLPLSLLPLLLTDCIWRFFLLFHLSDLSCIIFSSPSLPLHCFLPCYPLALPFSLPLCFK